MNREELYELVDSKVNEIFLAYQKAHGITHGGISPMESVELDDLQDALTTLVISVNSHNMPAEKTEMSEVDKRLARIANHAQKLRDAEEEKKEEEKRLYEEALNKVKALTPRIQLLITLANACVEQGIKFPSGRDVAMYGYGIQNSGHTYDFYADGIYHHLGFMGRGRTPITHLGIYAGGCCGCWDFYTDGNHTFSQDERDANIRTTAWTNALNAFLSEFDRFESAFLKWIDSLGE